MKDLQKKLENLRRQTRPSMVSRKLELERRRENNNNKEEKKTEVDILNEFRISTSFANENNFPLDKNIKGLEIRCI